MVGSRSTAESRHLGFILRGNNRVRDLNAAAARCEPQTCSRESSGEVLWKRKVFLYKKVQVNAEAKKIFLSLHRLHVHFGCAGKSLCSSSRLLALSILPSVLSPSLLKSKASVSLIAEAQQNYTKYTSQEAEPHNTNRSRKSIHGVRVTCINQGVDNQNVRTVGMWMKILSLVYSTKSGCKLVAELVRVNLCVFM